MSMVVAVNKPFSVVIWTVGGLTFTATLADAFPENAVIVAEPFDAELNVTFA